MDIQKSWEKALKNTEIVRARVKSLSTFSDTQVPYVLLSESEINTGDTVVRKGSITVTKPSIMLPPHIPQFEGFELENIGRFNEETIMNFLLVRGITLPSLKYQNQTYSLDLYEGTLKKAIEFHNDLLQKKEDVHTGLVVGPDDCWPFSMLIFICAQAARSASSDIQKLLDEYKKKEGE
ncbi:MAG: hypothetical protein ABIJ41_00910 [Candidatus Omnitrophota bacterium]